MIKPSQTEAPVIHPEQQHRALRSGVVMHRPTPALVWVRGEHAYEVVEALCPRDLFVRTGQLLHSMILDEQGGAEADLYVCPREDDFLLVADGLGDAGLARRLRQAAPEGAEFELAALGDSHCLIGLAGPYAWELIGELLGPEMATIGYLSCLPMPELDEPAEAPGQPAWPPALCLRSGTTGEFGYELFVARARVPALEAQLDELGARFDLVEVEGEVIDRAALENGFFCPRHRGVRGRSPVELQLQWRVAYDREYRGSEALRERAKAGEARRLTWVIGALHEPAPALGPLTREGRTIGELLDGFVSPLLGCFVGIAVIDRGLAHPWIEGLFASDGRELRTEAAPLLQNRSLFVDPRRHTYAHRDEDEFVPIVPGDEPDEGEVEGERA